MKWIHNQLNRLKIKIRLKNMIVAASIAVTIVGAKKLEFNQKEKYSVAAVRFLWECG